MLEAGTVVWAVLWLPGFITPYTIGGFIHGFPVMAVPILPATPRCGVREGEPGTSRSRKETI